MSEIPFNKEYQQVVNEILKRPYIKNRILKSDIDPALRKQYENALSKRGENLWRLLQSGALAPIIIGDIGGVITGGLPFAVAKYKKVKNTPKGELDMKAVDEAYKRFQAESQLAQQSSAGFALSKVQRDKLGKLLMTYRTAQIQAFNKAMQGWQDMTDKSNTNKERTDGFKRWAYFSTWPAIAFSAVASGVGGLVGATIGMIDDEWDDKTADRLAWDTLVSSLQSYFQGIGPLGYFPAIILNTLTNKPEYFNLPPVASKIGEAGALVKKILSGEDISAGS